LNIKLKSGYGKFLLPYPDSVVNSFGEVHELQEDKKNSPAEISRKVQESVAYKNFQRILEFDKNFFIFDRNYKDLKSAIEKFSEPESISLLFDHRESQLILYHICRLVHNFLASAKTLLEHTRNLTRENYEKTDFYEQYCKEVEIRFLDNPITGFIEDFRNYSLHYSLPITGFRISVINDKEKNIQTEHVIFFIEKKSLLKWSNWKKGKAFLEMGNEEIEIEVLIDDYYQQIFDFHGWINKKLDSIHSSEIECLQKQQLEIDEFMKSKSD
jgi:hypothetical protein